MPVLLALVQTGTELLTLNNTIFTMMFRTRFKARRLDKERSRRKRMLMGVYFHVIQVIIDRRRIVMTDNVSQEEGA